jgi:serine/threonine protein kinase
MLTFRLNHPNVLAVEGVSLDEKKQLAYVISPWCSNGNLRQWINREADRDINRVNLEDVFRQLLLGIAYLHSLKIVHSDLKPENVVMEVKTTDATDLATSSSSSSSSSSSPPSTIRVTPRICDFGISRADSILATSSLPTAVVFGLTKLYAAPEVEADRRYTVNTMTKSINETN